MKKLFFIALLSYSVNTLAMTGNDLLKAMEDDDNFFQYGVMNYISGVSHGLAYYDPKVVCATGVTNGQRYDSVKLYLQNNPNTRHLHAFHLVRAALSKDYGCMGSPNEKDYTSPSPNPAN